VAWQSSNWLVHLNWLHHWVQYSNYSGRYRIWKGNSSMHFIDVLEADIVSTWSGDMTPSWISDLLKTCNVGVKCIARVRWPTAKPSQCIWRCVHSKEAAKQLIIQWMQRILATRKYVILIVSCYPCTVNSESVTCHQLCFPSRVCVYPLWATVYAVMFVRTSKHNYMKATL